MVLQPASRAIRGILSTIRDQIGRSPATEQSASSSKDLD